MDPHAPRVLVADALDSDQLAPLRELGLGLSERPGISPEELRGALAGHQGLLVRSRTKVTSELLAAAPGLRVVGRAGTGVDNIDLAAATRAGVVVMNVPGGNVVAAAEHTLALLLACCRHIPQATASLQAGRWDRNLYLGTEVTGKTLGVVGLGRIGREVARRAQGLGLRVLAHDPLISSEVAEEMQIVLLPLEELLPEVDFLTLHVPLAARTRHLINGPVLARARPGLILVNVARGGVVDEAALLAALEEGHLGGAALDVFEEEPPSCPELVRHPRVVATPHLGASTREAQAGVARQIALQVGRFLKWGTVENAVNVVGTEPALQEEMAPWLLLSRRLGGLAGALAGGSLSRVEVTLFGEGIRFPREALSAEVLHGLLRPFVGERVNPVNALVLAQERGLEIAHRRREGHRSFPALVRVAVSGDAGAVSLDGTLFGRQNLRVVRAFGFNIDAPPEGPLLFCRNTDCPGIIGHLGTVLARAGINIANMSVGRDRPRGQALAVLNLDEEPSAEVLAAVAGNAGIRWVRHVPADHTRP